MTTGVDLLGRRTQFALFDDLADGVSQRGAAIMIEGAPGVGKTALLDEYSRRGAARGMLVLRTAGAVDESAVPYSGLHLLLHPLRDRIRQLPVPQCRALEVAFGVADGAAPTPFLAGLAALTLLSDAAAERPLLVVADDLHWLDPSSRAALFVAARRIASDPVLVVFATRHLPEGTEPAGVPVVELPPLSFIDADALLDRRPDHPQGSARRMLLELAAGNPLALVELDAADATLEPPFSISLTSRLERSFADRYADMPRAARLAILAAAIDEAALPVDVCGVAARVLEAPADRRWLRPAVDAGLIAPGDGAIEFRHPLVRSAVVAASSPDDRAAVLRALIDSVDDAGRTVWWRAELADAPDAALADELDAVGSRSLELGDAAHALSALRRAVSLTDDAPRRAERLMRAAEAAARTGANQASADLLTGAQEDSDDPLLRARCRWRREILPLEQSALAHGDFGPALAALDALRDAGDEDAAVAGLLHLAAVAWSHTVDDAPGRALIAAAQTFGLDESDPRMLLFTAVTQPVASADRVVELVHRRGPGDADDPQTAWLLGYALNLAGQIDTAAVRLRRAVEGLREQSDLAVLPQALMALAWECFLGGEYAEGRAHIGECIALALDVDDAGLAAAAGAALSLFDAVEGVAPDPAAIAGDSALAAQVLESQAMRSTMIAADGIAAIARGDARSGAASLGRLADPQSADHNLQFSVIALPDLVDAALATGSRAVAEASVARLERVHADWHAPTLESALGYARIALADDDALEDAGERLQRAPLPMPLHHARALLLIGSRLRRAKRIGRSRVFLSRALDGFGAIGAERWAARCRDELRATGERLADEPLSGRHVLTPQELLVAGYAATGLTNREVAERLFLSPSTVATHLHATYRKLGITERGQLAAAVGEA